MKNFLQVNRALAAEKNIYLNLNQIKSNPDGEPTVNRQSRLMSYQGWFRNLAMIFAVLTLSIANIGMAWGKYLYLNTANLTDWEGDNATFKLYPGTGSDVTGVKVYDHMYRFDVPKATGTMYFKRYNSTGATLWNQFPVDYNASYNVYKVTSWDRDGCSKQCSSGTYDNSITMKEIYLDVHTKWYQDSPLFKLTVNSKTYASTVFAGTNLILFSVPSPSGNLYFERWKSDNSTRWNTAETTYNSSYNAYEITDWGVVSGNYNVKIVDKPNYIYFDNSQIAFGTSNAYVVVGHDKPTAYSSTYAFGTKPIANTKLYYYNNTGNTWRDATYYAFLQNSSSFGGGSWGSSNLSKASKYTAAYTTATDLSWDKLYLFIPASGSNGAALSLQTATAASGLNNNQTVKYALSIDGGETFTDMSSGKTPGQISISAYKFVDGTYNGVSSGSQSISGGTTGTYSKSVPAAYTGKTTYSEGSTQTGYTFVGWHDGTSDLGTSNYTDYPTSAKTITARFKADQVTITLNGNSGTGHTASVKATYGVSTLPSITNPTRDGYVFAGWFTGTGGTGKLVIDIDGSLQPGISSYTDADGNWLKTSNVTLYAAWLTVHEPGVYTSTYGQDLTVVSNAAYEVYRYAVNSSTIFLNAGGETAPTVFDEPRRLFSFSQTGTAGACDITWSGWVGHTQVYGKGTNTTTASGEFKAHSVCQPTCRDQQGVIMCVSGYSQFSIYAQDADNTGKKHFKVFINGVEQAMTLNKGFTVRRFDLTPANTYVIRVTGQTDNNNLIQGISLKVPCVDFTVSRGGQENGTYTVGSYDGNALTCTPSVSGTYTYQWKQYKQGDPNGAADTINAVGDGANTASFTPNPASAGTYYYMCRVLNACGDKQVTSTTGTFTFNAASCGATAPGEIGKGTLNACTLSLTASGSPASNNTWYWQASADGTSTSESGTTKDVTSTGTYYIRSYYSTGSCWSDAVSVTVTASDLTPAAPSALGKSSITAKGVTLAVTDAANTNDYEFYVSTSSSAPGSGTSASYTSTSKSVTITDLYAGTTFYAWARAKCGSNKSAWTALGDGGTFTTSTVTVTHTLTNVSKTSGATTAGGSDYTAAFAAASGYSMPTPTVTIDGNTATSGTDYTWSSGTLTIPANKINGNIVITLNSAAAAPSSVAITGNWLYFAGETIELTATPTGGNGPVTYQWYKGGKENVNAIEGATTATYTKATCAFEDAGSYYCKVTCGGSQSTWGQSGNAYNVKIPRLYVKTGHFYDPVKTDFGNVDFTRVNGSTATASIVLGSNRDYCFNINDGCGNYYGNSGTMQYNNYGPWTTNMNNQDCGLRTTNGAAYVFTINYSDWTQLTTTVTYPSVSQAADKVIYFDNNDRKWSALHYRIGRVDNTQATAMTKVPGTDNLYKVTTTAYNNFMGWQIGNAAGDNGSGKSIYNTKNAPAITASIAYEGGAVTADAVTVTPGVDHSTGGDTQNNNCEFYSKTITTGMKTDNVSITAPSNGTLTVNYVDVSGAAQAFSSGNRDLAHTCIITVTAVPADGYAEPATVSINGASHGNRDQYTITGTTVVAATFSPASYTVTLNTNDGTINAGNVTSYTYGIGATLPTNVTKDGFTFGGWYDNEGLTGSAVTTISTTATGNKEYWAKWTEDVAPCPTGGDIFTLEMTYSGGSAVKVAANSTLAMTATHGTATGGTVTFGNQNGSSNDKMQIKKPGIAYINGDDAYIRIDFSCPIKTGDVLTFTSNENKEISFTTTDTRSTSVKTSSKKWTVTKAFNDATTLYIWCGSSSSVNLHTINIVRPVTVTFDKNGGSSVSPSSATYDGTSSCVLAETSRTDYHLDGWNTRADGSGDDLGLPGEVYHLDDVTTSTTTVYAIWSAKSCASGTLYKFQVNTGLTNGGLPHQQEVYVKTSDFLSIMTGGYLKAYNSSSSSDYIAITDKSRICIGNSSSYLLVQLDCPLRAGDKIKSTVTTQTLYVTKADVSRTSTVTLPIAANNEQTIPEALVGATELKIWSGSSSGGKISYFEITRSASTYNVTYDGNDQTSAVGTVPTDATNYAYNATVTTAAQGSLAKTNYTFGGWNTANDGTGTNTAAGSTFSITDNTTLYAKWTQAVTLDGTTNGGSDGSATAVWNATALTGITHATPAAGYKLIGYYTTATDEPTTGVKVLNASGTFSSTTVADYITSGKWSRTGEAPTLYARYEASAGLTWNLTVNAKIDLTTESKTSDYPQVGSMTDVATNGLSVSKSAKANLTSIIQTVSSLDPDKYVKATFVVASGYKFTPSKIKLKVQPKDNAETIKVVLTDGVRTYEHDFGSQSAGSIHSLEATNADADKYMQGTVTLKIYAYGNTTGYRLGTPITIEGAVTATCDMPTYTSVDHGATEYQEGDEAESLSVVGGAHVNTYQWYWNTANDRSDVSKTAATAADGTGYNTYTFTPQTTSAYSRYYWCELTATDCGTIKTEAVGITVTEVKTSASIDWTDPVGTVHYGGGGYTIKATVKETTWAGGPEDLTLSAPAGIRIYNVTRGTTDSKDWIQANFDVQTSFDRETYSSSIPFVVSAPAQTGWDAINDEHGVTYDACAGGGGEGSAFIEVTSGVTTANTGMSNYWEAAGVGRLNKAYNQAMGSSADAQTIAGHAFSYRTRANNSNWMVNTYIAGVTKIRLYFYASAAIASAKLGISKVLYDTEYFNSQGSRAVVFDNVATSADSYAAADKGWIEFTLPEMAANSYCYFATNTGNLYIYGVELFSGSVGTGGTETTNLTWSNGTVDGGSVTGKTQSSANFTITATRDAVAEKSLGAITYSSSNTSCATVDSETGEVTITATGASELTTTITATLAASGCYKKKEITYTLTIPGVTCSIETGTLTSDVTSKCSTVNATLTLTGFESGASIQWYKGESTISDDATYHITTEGTTSTLVTKEAGTYSVMVSKTTPTSCSDRSNSITISNASASASATKIVDSWYVKNGRLTPDIELWSVSEGATLGSVAWSPANETGLNCVLRDGIVYLEGKEPNANESGADKVYTLTLTLKDACGGDHEEITKTITITHQKNTDKHVLAFVVNGTKNGGFTAGISADQTTNLDLYKKISAEFDVLATNAYATDDEKALKQYYSQFDILCITDYPNTGEKGNNKKSYIDAMGSIVDIRPILTMEAFVAKWGNWKAKDISGTPHSPDPRQYAMDLQCKDHEIFDGTHPEVVGEGDEAMYRVTMVDATKEDYATLDGNTPGTDAYDADDYPALQGFEFDATMAADGLLPLGQIYNGSPTNTLQVGIERQTEMSARLMVLGIQQLAMERLTADGQTVVINALKYLMKKNEEEIADCSVAFVGGAEDGLTTDWNNDANWSTGKKPDKTTREVRILAPVVITNSQTITSPTIKIADGGTYDGGTTANGSITINAGGALKVKGEVVGVTAPAYSKKKATDPSKLVLNTSETAQSALILDNENGMTRATVNLYSLGRKIDSKYQFQYYAVPMEVVPVNPSFAGTGIYTYVWHENGGWERRGYYTDLYAFEGIGITTSGADPRTYTMTGNLASTADKEITLTKESDGENIIGNSWTAPINIASLVDAFAEDENVEKVVYIYITGNDNMEGDHRTTEVAGKWLAIPIDASGWPGWKGQKVIPAMQAFYIKANAATMLTLNYDEMVRTTPNEELNRPLKAPHRAPLSDDAISLLKLRVEDSSTYTDLYLFEGNRFSDSYDNGWEAKQMGGDGCMQLYAQNEADKMAVLATDELEGTVVGFEPGKETGYTISFSGEGNGYYLNDIKLRNSVRISEGETYTFTFEEGDAANRFYISRTAINAPEVATGMENLDAAAPRVQKIIYNDKLYIIRGGRLYDATGKVVK